MESSADQIKQNNIALMGGDLGAIYSELWQEVGRMYSNWQEYVSLYGTNPGRIALLNNTAGHFFRTVQDGLWERTLLHLSRITDPAQQGKKRNLSIHSLTDAISDIELKSKVTASIARASEKCAFARDWRNRFIAHADFDLALDDSAKPLATASRLQVREALEAIEEVLNTVSMAFHNSATRFSDMAILNSGEDLIYLLEFALRKKEEQEGRITSGQYTEEDLADLHPRSI
ncbi:AbiU2 domain-containing protein [Undibacterium griseum]|uniref:HEPN AbiU2-like domain-containing protein n=1 Tax=Undibacterium griseum TaxID=2762295 RepID=A0ABR6YJ15_9BURK|nr:hypothetical protein [Undibacterium griseum]MBC3883780.1 hypothetical protein [Undibacterium griseum]